MMIEKGKSMKKKLKIFLLIVLVIILATAGYLLYMFKFKEYDVADEEVEQIIENPYTIELPDGTTITLDDNGEVVDSQGTDPKGTTPVTEAAVTSSDGDSAEGDKEGVTPSPSSSDGETTTSGNKDSSSTAGDSGNPETDQKPTVASIKNKYVPTLDNLQSQADAKINTLVSHAMKEYTDKKANGESIDFGYFYNKYMGAANGLEARTDAVFAGVIKVAEVDLEANGFDKSYVQSMVDDYDAKKKARRDSLMKKAMSQ